MQMQIQIQMQMQIYIIFVLGFPPEWNPTKTEKKVDLQDIYTSYCEPLWKF